jgi:hypothetical protein
VSRARSLSGERPNLEQICLAPSRRMRRRGAAVSWCVRDGWLHGCGARRTAACCHRSLVSSMHGDGTGRHVVHIESRGGRAEERRTRPRDTDPRRVRGRLRAGRREPLRHCPRSPGTRGGWASERAAGNKDRARLPAPIPPFPPVPPPHPPRAPLRLLLPFVLGERKKGKPLRRGGTGLPSRYVRGDPISLGLRFSGFLHPLLLVSVRSSFSRLSRSARPRIGNGLFGGWFLGWRWRIAVIHAGDGGSSYAEVLETFRSFITFPRT